MKPTNFWGIDVGGKKGTISVLIDTSKTPFKTTIKTLETVEEFWKDWAKAPGPLAIDAPLSYSISSKNGMRGIDKHWKAQLPKSLQKWVCSPHSLLAVPLKGPWLAKCVKKYHVIECHPRVGMYAVGTQPVKKALSQYKTNRFQSKVSIKQADKAKKIILKWLNNSGVSFKINSPSDDHLDAMFCALVAMTFIDKKNIRQDFFNLFFKPTTSKTEKNILSKKRLLQMYVKVCSS